MHFKKFQASQLFTGHHMLNSNKVLVTDTNGIVKDIIDQNDAGDDILKLEGILTPGFINCHCHLELSHMKGLIPQKTGLIDFVFKVVTQRHFAAEEILNAIQTAEDEMLLNGIVAVGDICNNATTFQQKKLKRLTYYNFIEASGWLPAVATERFERSKAFYTQFANLSNNNSIVPHAPYSVSDNLWEQIAPYYKNKVVTIHNQETAFEDEFFMNGTGDFTRMYQLMKIDNSHFNPQGSTSLQSYFNKLKHASNVLLIHNTYTNGADVTYANQQAHLNNQTLFWCLCPNANLYIEDKLPPIGELVKQNSNIVLGTDSLASNNCLSILDELKTIATHFPQLAAAQLLQFATLNGAKALNLDEQLGSFDLGKQPGVLLVDSNFESVQRLV